MAINHGKHRAAVKLVSSKEHPMRYNDSAAEMSRQLEKNDEYVRSTTKDSASQIYRQLQEEGEYINRGKKR